MTKRTHARPGGYGFVCQGCGQFLLLVNGSPPLTPSQTIVRRLSCARCGKADDYIGRMVRIPADAERQDFSQELRGPS